MQYTYTITVLQTCSDAIQERCRSMGLSYAKEFLSISSIHGPRNVIPIGEIALSDDA